MKKKIRVVGYVRVSSLRQVQGVSLETQKKTIKETIKKMEVTGHKFTGKWYEEKGESGKTFNRTELNKLIKDGEEGKFDKFCIYILFFN